MTRKQFTLSVSALEDRCVPSVNSINLVDLETRYNPNDPKVGTVRVGVRLEVSKPDGVNTGGILAPEVTAGFTYKTAVYWAETASLTGRHTFAAEHTHPIRRGARTANTPYDNFNANELGKPPSWARYAISVVRAVGVAETTTEDNATAVDLRSGKSTPVVAANPTPKTFVFLLGGFISQYTGSSDGSGMLSLADQFRNDKRFGNNIFAFNGRGTGPAVLNDARTKIDQELRRGGYRPGDRVFLVGHSLGGDAARILAADVSQSDPGAQPAAALVTIDPISFRRFQETGNLNQSADSQETPAGVNVRNILNFVQTKSGPKGYHLSGLDARHDVTVSGSGVTHTTIDDDVAVRRRILDFLAAL